MSASEAAASAAAANLPLEEVGCITLIVGPMCSEKTSRLMSEMRRHQVAGRTVVGVKPAMDTRAPSNGTARQADSMLTHDNVQLGGVISVTRLDEAIDRLLNYQVICVDEGQFIPDVAPTAERLANAGKIVIIAALSGTHERMQFESVTPLFSLAETIKHVHAVCRDCGSNNAPFTYRNQKSLPQSQRTKVEVVSSDPSLYIPTCRRCHMARRKLDLLAASSSSSSSSQHE